MLEIRVKSSFAVKTGNNMIVSSVNGWYKIVNVMQGVPFKEEIDGNLDSCTAIYFGNNAKKIKQYAPIMVILNDGTTTITKSFLAVKDIVEQISPFNVPLKYKHTLQLIEPTVILEKQILPADAYTRKYKKDGTTLYTLKDCLLEAISKADGPVFSWYVSKYSLSQSLQSLTENVVSEEFFFNTPTLFREVLDDILKVVNARCYVESITDFSEIVIGYRSYNTTEIANIGDKLDDKSGYMVTPEFDKLSKQLEIYGENAISSNRLECETLYDSFKATDGQATLSTNNMGIVTPHPVEKFTSFKLKCQYKVVKHKLGGLVNNLIYTAGLTAEQIFGDSSATFSTWFSNNFSDQNQSSEYDLPELELIDYLYDIEDYNRLSSSDKLKALCYQRGTNTVNVGTYQTIVFFPLASLAYIIKDALINQYVGQYGTIINELTSALNALSTWIDGLTNTVVTLGGLLESCDTAGMFDISKMIYKVKYVPYYDLHAKFSKDNAFSLLPETTQLDNQNERTIDILRYGDYAKKKINSIGNNGININVIKNKLDDIIALGSITSQMTLTCREYSIYDNFIEIAYKFEADYNANRGKISIDRTRRLYNIPLSNEAIDRNILIKKYILVTDDTLDYNNSSVIDNGVNILLNCFKQFQTREVVKAAVITTFSDATGNNADSIPGSYQLGIARYSMATSMFFTFKFYDNYSSGLGVGNRVIGGKKVILNRYVNKNDGTYSSIKIELCTNRTDNYSNVSTRINDISKLPLIINRKTTSDTDGMVYTKIATESTLKYPKDKFTRDIYTIQYEFIADKDYIFIGPKLAELNGLMEEEYQNFKLYKSSNQLYTKYDTKGKGTPSDSFNNDITHNDFNSDSIYINNVKNKASWAITDANDNIVIAYNRPDKTSEFYDIIKLVGSNNRTYNGNTDSTDTIENYTVSYYIGNGFENITPASVRNVDVIPAFPNLTIPGATFVWWYYEPNYTNKAYPNDPLTHSVTLYAKFILDGESQT